MQKQIKILLTLLTALILAVSCAENNPNDPNNNDTTQDGGLDNNNNNNGITIETASWKNNANYPLLQKTWETSATSTTSKVFIYTDNKNNDTGAFNSYHTYPSVFGMNYNIVIESITWISDTEGIMYGKIRYISDYSLIGKYYAVAFQNLTENSVDFADLSSASPVATLEEAKTTFTIETFATYNSYTVQTAQ